MQIRDDQVETLRQQAARTFEQELQAHLEELVRGRPGFSPECSVRYLVSQAVETSLNYGLTTRGSIRLYAELMLLFGCGFDTDPLFPWAPKVLHNPYAGDSASRAEQLHKLTLHYLAAVAGDDEVLYVRALETAALFGIEPCDPRSDGAAAKISNSLRALYRERCDAAGEYGLLSFSSEVAAAAAKLGNHPLTVASLSLLMFLFGHRVFEDPLHPWVHTALRDPSRRGHRLYQDTIRYCERWADYLKDGEVYV